MRSASIRYISLTTRTHVIITAIIVGRNTDRGQTGDGERSESLESTITESPSHGATTTKGSVGDPPMATPRFSVVFIMSSISRPHPGCVLRSTLQEGTGSVLWTSRDKRSRMEACGAEVDQHATAARKDRCSTKWVTVRAIDVHEDIWCI